MIDSIIESLSRPEYIHILINPLPIYGLAMGVFALVIGLVMRSRPAQVLALWLVLFSALSAWPVYVYGQRAYHRVYVMADGEGQVSLDVHRRCAEKLIYAFYALAAVALSALVVPKRIPKTAVPLTVITLALSAGAMAVGGWIAYPGGKIRHTEFREVSSSDETSLERAPTARVE
jgi:hypothetical protein